jgi:uncharacterized protein (DUF305 family)
MTPPFSRRARLALVLLALALPALPAAAQHAGHGGHGGHGAAAPAAPADSEATKAFKAINARMHGAMDIPYTNDAEVDFIRGMIPHHEGAVEMAKVVLRTAKDPVVRKLAEEIVASQQAEIALMRDWLKARGK